MYSKIIKYCSQFVELTSEDIEMIRSNFYPRTIKRKDFLLEEGKYCRFIAFISSGVVRHYHIKDGNEITCDITLDNSFITDFKSFTQSIPSNYYFQALKETDILMINQSDLLELYQKSQTFEKFGRIMAEQVAQRTIDIAMSLASDKPEERVYKLLTQRPHLFQLVPQRYLANLLGITPESLSRIRKRQLKKLNNSQ